MRRFHLPQAPVRAPVARAGAFLFSFFYLFLFEMFTVNI
jgi:hypothetical protein